MPTAPAQHFLVLFLILLCTHASSAQEAPLPLPTPPSPTPAPAPAPLFCNITQVIQSAGQYTTFLQLLSETQVGEKFQNQANQTDVGITIFAPTDKAFAAQPAATLLKSITEQQKVSLCQYHALNKWYSLASLQQADNTVLSTYASFNGGGGKYTLNVSNQDGTVAFKTEWSNAEITSTLYNANPCSIFAIDEVLLPVEIFGVPLPAPAPAPSTGASDNAPASSSSSKLPSSSSGPASSQPSHAPSLHSFQILAYISLLFCTLKLLLL